MIFILQFLEVILIIPVPILYIIEFSLLLDNNNNKWNYVEY